MAASSLYLQPVSESLRERYIESGYRPWSRSFWSCWKTVFHVHNETLNIWTHAMPVVYFLWALSSHETTTAATCTTSTSQDQGCVLMMYGYVLSVLLLFGVSTFAHIFNCLSAFWREFCFVLDYAAISFYGVASANVYLAVFYPDAKLSSVCAFCVLVVFTGLLAMFLSCWTRLERASSYRYIIRTFAFICPFVAGNIPMFLRLYGDVSRQSHDSIDLLGSMSTTDASDPNDVVLDINNSHLNMPFSTSGSPQAGTLTFFKSYCLHLLYFVAAAVVNVARVPEKWWPGHFDIYGHSHQWFHVLVFMAVREQFWMITDELSRMAGKLHTTNLGAPRSLDSQGLSYAHWTTTATLGTTLVGTGFLLYWFALSTNLQLSSDDKRTPAENDKKIHSSQDNSTGTLADSKKDN